MSLKLPTGARAASRYAVACLRQHRSFARSREEMDDFWRAAWWCAVLAAANPDLRIGLHIKKGARRG